VLSTCPEDGGDTFLRNVGKNRNHTVLQPRRRFSTTLNLFRIGKQEYKLIVGSKFFFENDDKKDPEDVIILRKISGKWDVRMHGEVLVTN
jgi:hypothetical protein